MKSSVLFEKNIWKTLVCGLITVFVCTCTSVYANEIAQEELVSAEESMANDAMNDIFSVEELDQSSEAFNATENPYGTKDNPWRYLVAEDNKLTIKDTFLHNWINLGIDNNMSELYVSFETDTEGSVSEKIESKTGIVLVDVMKIKADQGETPDEEWYAGWYVEFNDGEKQSALYNDTQEISYNEVFEEEPDIGAEEIPTVVSDGFVTETINDQEVTRYYEDGQYVTGMKLIGDDHYFFDSNGILQTGFQKTEQTATTGEISDMLVSGHTYEFLCAKDTSFVMDVSGGSLAAKANVQIYKRNGTGAQAYVLNQLSDGSWQILNTKGMVLDITGASLADRANVQTYTWNETKAQRFDIQDNEDGTVTFFNSGSGKALDVSGGLMQNSQNVQQYNPNATAAQKWILVDVTQRYYDENGIMQTGWLQASSVDGESNPPVDGHLYEMVCAKDPAFVMDVAGGSSAAKANMQIYKCNHTGAQIFELQKQSDDTWKILNSKGKVLDIAGASVKSGANLQTYTWNGTKAQRFSFDENDDGSYTIYTNTAQNMVLDVSGAVMANSQNVQQYAANGTVAQKWFLRDLTKYYLGEDGIMRTGWQIISGKKYYFFSDGKMAIGWQSIGGSTRYFSLDGEMQTGWQTINGSKHYFNSAGVMLTGEQNIGGTWYYFNGSGVLTNRIETHVANMKAAKSANQLILVSASGSRATVSMYQKNSNGTWKKLLSTSGYVGKSGVGKAREGLSVTPEGAYHILKAFGIKSNPGCAIGYTKVDYTHYYVADPASPYYNKFVSTRNVSNFRRSYGEQIIKYPPAYNYILDFDYNSGGTPYAGSCFFLHCSTGKATAGCVTVPEATMVQILKKIQKNCMIVIANGDKVYSY